MTYIRKTDRQYATPTGRPTKYSIDMLKKAQAYYQQHMQNKQSIPYIEELELELGVDDDQINEWAKRGADGTYDLSYPRIAEFYATIKDIKKLQRVRLLKETIKPYPAGAIFQLKANHGLMESEKRILQGDKNADPINIIITEADKND